MFMLGVALGQNVNPPLSVVALADQGNQPEARA